MIGLQTKFTKDYNKIIKMLNSYKNQLNYQNFTPSHLLAIYQTPIINSLNAFEYQINEFINNQSLDFDSDNDLAKTLNIAKQQLDHIQQLRQELGI